MRRARALAGEGADVVRTDATDRVALDHSFAGVSGVYSVQNHHVSGYGGEVEQGRNVAEAAARAGVRLLVYVGRNRSRRHRREIVGDEGAGDRARTRSRATWPPPGAFCSPRSVAPAEAPIPPSSCPSAPGSPRRRQMHGRERNRPRADASVDAGLGRRGSGERYRTRSAATRGSRVLRASQVADRPAGHALHAGDGAPGGAPVVRGRRPVRRAGPERPLPHRGRSARGRARRSRRGDAARHRAGRERAASRRRRGEFVEELEERIEERGEEDLSDVAAASTRHDVGRVVVGLLATVAGPQLPVVGAQRIAEDLGISGGVVGLTLVAVGTSLPELVTAVQSARRGETALLAGNVLGSNVFNSTAVAGSCSSADQRPEPVARRRVTGGSQLRTNAVNRASVGRWNLMMNAMPDRLPPDVVSLLDRLDSVLQMELLIALYDAGEPLQADVLTRRIGGSVEQVQDCLDALVGKALAVLADGDARKSYSYRSSEMDPTVDRLAELYLTRKVRVVSALVR